MAFGKIGESITGKLSKLKGVPKKTALCLLLAFNLAVATPQKVPAQDKNFKDGVSTHTPSKQKKGKSLDELTAEGEKITMISKVVTGVGFSLFALV